jgi:hypothetical protein
MVDGRSATPSFFIVIISDFRLQTSERLPTNSLLLPTTSLLITD